MMKSMLKICIKDVETIKYTRDMISKILKEGMGMDDYLYEMAISEALNNAVLHGYENKGKRSISINLSKLSDRRVSVRIKHYGKGFPGNKKLQRAEEKSNNIPPEELFLESGRGLKIMMEGADYVCYNRAGNEVILVKRKET
ncbi:ATP-binding protein [Isachenkonia alkalipeptolytica]|uniref:ATP-binding protein n=1 Tax=Isachenkonia alkalipeptolytica TaxID=2565777 RepID=A0AA44BEG9_9CLOT|nr:ATP-binding protein [Isachenkonia alkalipeptolytica]NBG87536.1 ATP-binding protein [Isachenkonia alkalipeptolytica]